MKIRLLITFKAALLLVAFYPAFVNGQAATNRQPSIEVLGKDSIMSLQQLMKVASDTVRTNIPRFPLTNCHSKVVFGDFRTNRIATVYFFDATRTGFLPAWVNFDAEFKATFQQGRCELIDSTKRSEAR